MTLMERGIAAMSPALVGRTLEVRWNSLRLQPSPLKGAASTVKSALVLRIEILSADIAIVEAWVEADSNTRNVLERQTRRISIVADERHLHLDISGDHDNHAAPTARMTIARGDAENAGTGFGRLVYIATTVLHQAGFAAGTHDRPSLLQHAAKAADAATA